MMFLKDPFRPSSALFPAVKNVPSCKSSDLSYIFFQIFYVVLTVFNIFIKVFFKDILQYLQILGFTHSN